MKRRRIRLAPLWFLLPNLIGFLIFTAWPVIYSFAAGFTNSSLLDTGNTRFVGLNNFTELVHDEKFWLSFINTVYLMIGIPVSIALSLWLAILLHRKMRGADTLKALLFLPSVTSGVAIMILWKQLYNPDFGPVNAMIEGVANWFGVHLHGPQWLLSTDNLAGLKVEHVGAAKQHFGLGARDALNILGIWAGIGGANMLLYLAGLSNVPPELIEAAQVDGAGKWQVFRSVTWPQLAPTTFFISVMSIIGGLQGGFETAKVMTNGGPAGTTSTMAFYIYTKAFEEFRIGYASAVSWILFAMIFAFTLVNWKFGNKDGSFA
ncbi:MAG TPA: sugar ABC transporter permease [Fimbriimonadaceae bacterium]|nr:sugar ABC transporter permease [Fimbriimonadaceae bacterium]